MSLRRPLSQSEQIAFYASNAAMGILLARRATRKRRVIQYAMVAQRNLTKLAETVGTFAGSGLA